MVKSGNREEAINKFVKSARLNTNYPKNYLYWGLTLAMDGKPEAAIKKYEKVLELEPGNSNAYAYWGVALDLGKKRAWGYSAHTLCAPAVDTLCEHRGKSESGALRVNVSR